MNKPMTVGDLLAHLTKFDPSFPVLVSGYEWGFQYPRTPRMMIAERRSDVSDVGGDWEEADGPTIGWGVVVLER